MRRRLALSSLLAGLLLAASAPAGAQTDGQNRPPFGPNDFPIAVWLQSPKLAPRYRAAGINLYVGLFRGPTEEQLADLDRAGMRVICAQNEVGLEHRDDETIAGWMHGDEPDNAQSLGQGKGYGPPVEPRTIIADYERIRENDPTRPVLLNLGQGVAWDGWVGRGVRTNHPEDYREYVKGGDIISFDIYPAVHPKPEVAGKLWYVGRGVERLVDWTRGKKIVWNCIECTRIHAQARATPHQVKAEVWMSIIHGSTGIIYFVHEWHPQFNDHALLDDEEMLSAVTAINAQVRELAPVINGEKVEDGVKVTPADRDGEIAAVARRHGQATHVFAVNMRDAATRATFCVEGIGGTRAVEVLGEERTLPAASGEFEDEFAAWDVHLYRIE